MTPPLPGPDQGLNSAVAAELRAEQGRQKMSVAQLAELADIPYGSVRRYLNAERHIDVTVLQEISRALQVNPADIVQAAAARAALQTGMAHVDLKASGVTELDRRRGGKPDPSSFEEPNAARDEDREKPRID